MLKESMIWILIGDTYSKYYNNLMERKWIKQ
jgi:hypothetical protein